VGGSIFWLELPCVAGTISSGAPGLAPLPDTPKQMRLPTLANKFCVLVVDDSAMNCDIAKAFLRSAGHDVTCTESGTEAVALASTMEFDIILMDVRMPGVDGLEATRRIRALAHPHGRVPIVAVTAQVFADRVSECRAAGMDSYLAKPFTPALLLEALESAFAVARVRRVGERASAEPIPMRVITDRERIRPQMRLVQ
jgi:CheY-like chemotaxis protein